MGICRAVQVDRRPTRGNLGVLKPGGGGHGRAGFVRNVPGMPAIPGGGGHGGPAQLSAKLVDQHRAPGRIFTTEQLELHCVCPITQAERHTLCLLCCIV